MREGLLILGDHLPDPKTSSKLSPSARHRQFVELAVRGEALGFDSVWLGEHHLCDYILSSPPVVLAAIAERTSHMRLGTGVTLLPTLDPVRVAEDYATVDCLSGGRVELVVGRGVLRRTYADFGADVTKSRAAFREKLELLLRLWSEEGVTWSGEFRPPLEEATVMPRPVQLPPTVWVGGGSSNDSVDLAARLGLPLMLPSVLAAPEVFLPMVQRYRDKFADHGHDESRMAVGACSHVHVAADGETAKRRWRPHHMQYIEWVTKELIPWGAGANIGDPAVASSSLPLPHYDALLAGPSICGSPDQVLDRIGTIRDALGLDLHIAMFDHGGIPEGMLLDAIDLFGEQVLPHLSG